MEQESTNMGIRTSNDIPEILRIDDLQNVHLESSMSSLQLVNSESKMSSLSSALLISEDNNLSRNIVSFNLILNVEM